MTYATADMIKFRMRIGDGSRDPEIATAIAYSDAFCDGAIRAAGGAVPVASPTQDLKEASADIGAYYMFRASNPTVANYFLGSGETILARYIQGAVTVAMAGAKLTGRSGVRDET